MADGGSTESNYSLFAEPFFCHAGLEEPAPYLIRGHPDVVPTNPGSGPGQASGTISYTESRFSPGTLDSGFRRNDDFLLEP